MKGILLAGGHGTRLYPLTRTVSKQLLPVHDKPMIYYSLSILMLAQIREVLIISTPVDTRAIERLLGNGNDLGMDIQYAVQDEPRGLAQAYTIGRDFLEGQPSAMMLGDNIFYGAGFTNHLREAVRDVKTNGGGVIFGTWVPNPSSFGVMETNDDGRIVSVEEKPLKPKSNYAITGLYFFDGNAPEYAAQVKPSARGELEITSVMQCYLDQNWLRSRLLGRGFVWLDAGTHKSFAEASEFIRITEHHQKIKIACLEEIAHINGWIDVEQITRLAQAYPADYKKYLLSITERINK